MDEPKPQSEELCHKWGRDGVLYHLWTALQLDNAADHLETMQRHETGLDADKLQKRQTMLALLSKFCGAEIDKELVLGYEQLREYLLDRGLIHVHAPLPIQEASIGDSQS